MTPKSDLEVLVTIILNVIMVFGGVCGFIVLCMGLMDIIIKRKDEDKAQL